MPATICLVTPGHIASTPRLVKEADALCASGYRVHVVAGRHYEPNIPFDEQLIAAAAWRYTAVEYGARQRSVLRKLARHFARMAVARHVDPPIRLAARAVHGETLRLAAAAAATNADYFIGHCLPGMAAAGLAAGRQRAGFGCDLEDFHDAETTAALTRAADRNGARRIQSVFLPRARHLTAAAPLIAQAYEREYGVRPVVVLNVFPRRDGRAAGAEPCQASAANPARLYWFSQTVGPGRGLEAMIAVIAEMRTPAVLQLRGFALPEYRAKLLADITARGRPDVLQFLPPAAPTEMARCAADADLGLSVEESEPLNRDLCLTNKIFVYLLAGIPVLLSTTTAQSALAPELGAAALLADLQQPGETAAMLDAFLADAGRVASARRAARALADTRFCWDVEQEKFLSSIRAAIGVP